MATLFVDKIDPQSGTSLEIGSSGDTITIPSGVTQTGVGGTNTPAFLAYQDSSQVLTNNTNTKLSFNTEVFDTDSAFASNTFTVPTGKGGKYYFFTSCPIFNATPTRYSINIRLNGSEKSLLELGNTGSYSGVSTSTLINVSVGDTIDVYFYHNNGSDINTYAGEMRQFFGGYKIIE